MKNIFTIHHHITEGQAAGRTWLYLLQRLQLRILSLTRIRDSLCIAAAFLTGNIFSNQY
ncbi:MAG: hypothetical protein NTW29_08190 [Bacteroidetes bacterium]|nr:hypothetical protein [Bacteroidota bacterium]